MTGNSNKTENVNAKDLAKHLGFVNILDTYVSIEASDGQWNKNADGTWTLTPKIAA